MTRILSASNQKNIISHTQLERMIPHSESFEEFALGSLLSMNNKDAILSAQKLLKPEDFYFEKNQIIFKIILNLINTNNPVAVSTVSAELKRLNKLDKIGGVDYLLDIHRGCPTQGTFASYASVILEASKRRGMLMLSERIKNLAFEEDSDVDLLINRAEKSVYELGQKTITRDFAPISALTESVYAGLGAQRERYKQNADQLLGVPSGLSDLDNILGGYQKTDLIIVAARPGLGKTSLGLNTIHHAARFKKIPSAIFSLEMGYEQLVQRFIAMEARIPLQALRRGSLTDEEWARVESARDILNNSPIAIDDTPGITVVQIQSKIRRLLHDYPDLGIVVVDYLQLVKGTSSESRLQEVASIGRDLKMMAKDLQIPVIAICQLSRAVESRGDHTPILSDLRESGTLEQDADIVLFPYRGAYYNGQPKSDNKGKSTGEIINVDESKAKIIIGKHRNGPIGSVDVMWAKEWASFENVARPSDLVCMSSSIAPIEDFAAPMYINDEQPYSTDDPFYENHE